MMNPTRTSKFPTFVSPRIKRGLSIVLLAVCADTSAAIATSTFDNGANDLDGWDAVSCPNPGLCSLASSGLTPIHSTTGGVDDSGFIRAVDPNSGAAARGVAPAKFLNALSIGQTLSFSANVTDPDETGFFASTVAPLVTIEFGSGGSGSTLVYGTTDLPVIGVGMTPGPWKDYSILISPDDPGWEFFDNSDPGGRSDATLANFETVLADAERLTFIMEWLQDDADLDTGGLDNVNLVPVPAALPLLLSALFGLGFSARRKRTRS